MNLLEKVRKLNSVLLAYEEINITKVVEVLSELEDANVYCANPSGMLLAYKQKPQCIDETKFTIVEHDKYISELYTRYLQNIIKTECIQKNEFMDNATVVVPIYFGNRRLGTLVVEIETTDTKNDDLVVIEFAATAIGAELRRVNNLREKELQKVMNAVETLSYTETKAVKAILGELQDLEGYLIASKVADGANITRSVIVNALRKLESAGVVETRSLGMKGTYIKVVTPLLLEKLN